MRDMRKGLTGHTLGVSIAHDAVRAVAVRSDQVIWSSEAPRVDDSVATLDAALRECLAAAPRRRFGRTPVSVAIGPHAAQLRLLTELPALGDNSSLARVVEEGASRFFLRNGAPLVTTGVRIIAPGEAWAAAFERPLAEAIRAVCRDERLALRGIVPSVAVLGAGLDETSAVWRDGSVVARLTMRDDRLVALRRAPGGSGGFGADKGDGILLRVAAPLTALGEHAWRYADAYGAAILPRDETVVLRTGRIASSAGRTPRWRLALATGVCTVSIAVALVAPGITASRASHRAERQLSDMGPTRRRIAENSWQIGRVTAELNEIAAFAARRRSATLFLEALTTALPPEATIVALRTDSAGGNLMALAPRAAAVLSALDSISAVAASEIVGPVTREVIGTRELERVTVRFRWNDGSAIAARRRS